MRRRRPGGLSCRQVGKDLQSFLDEELSDDDRRARLRAHLEQCRDCGLAVDTYRAIHAALGQQAPQLQSPALDRLRQFGAALAAGDIDVDD